MATDDHMLVTAVGLPDGATSVSFGSFELESGQTIKDVVIGYTAYGTLNEVRVSAARHDTALFLRLGGEGFALECWISVTRKTLGAKRLDNREYRSYV